MDAPERSAARANPLTSFPASAVPPPTSSTTRNLPESDHEIGESFQPPLRPISQAPGSCRSHSIPSSSSVSRNPPRTSPRPGRSPAELSPSTMPPVFPLAPPPICSASKTPTLLSGASLRSQAAAARPVKPPPTTAKSTCSGSNRGSGRKSMDQGDSPHPFVKARAVFGASAIPSTPCGTATPGCAPLFSSRIHYPSPAAVITVCSSGRPSMCVARRESARKNQRPEAFRFYAPDGLTLAIKYDI